MISGTYCYLLNQKKVEISENFLIENLPNGYRRTFSKRLLKNTSLEVKALQKETRFLICEIKLKTDNKQVLCRYEFASNSFRFFRQSNGLHQNQTFPVKEPFLFFPLMRCFQGEVILKIERMNQNVLVVVPDLESPENLLAPTYDRRSAKKLERSVFRLPTHRISLEADTYEYINRKYDKSSRFWISENGLLLAYTFQSNETENWTVFLSSITSPDNSN